MGRCHVRLEPAAYWYPECLVDDHDQRRQWLYAIMAARLQRVRGGLTDAQFAQLLADMVRTAERFAEIEAKPGRLRPDVSPDAIRPLIDLAPG